MFSKVQSPAQDLVREFAATHYPDLYLHPKMIEQLSWLQSNSVVTSQANVQLRQDLINIEIKRSLARYNALLLLMGGGTSAYAKFVESQAIDVALSMESFSRLSDAIQALSFDARRALMATCFITKSDAAELSVPVERRPELPKDSEQFITHMVTHFPMLFPICARLNPAPLALLPYAFYQQSHLRHMLDMEGGYTMVATIAKALRLRTMTYEHYELWFARWIINIAGLEGHVDARGSIYLTEPVADCILALKLELDQLWLNPDHPVLDHYLEFRKKQLQVDELYIAYLGALMRKYSPNDGREIQCWFESLSEDEQQQKRSDFRSQLEQTKVTPTFKPTVLVNLLKAGSSVSEALTLFTEIESYAMQLYVQALEKGEMSFTTPLCYRQVALEKFLIPIKNYYERHHGLPELTLDVGGNLTVSEDALQEEPSLINTL